MSFLQSGFLLAGAAAAALPILIHLLLRQRARMVPIGSVRFLEQVIRQHTRRRKIRQWILLAMRVLAILLLAALFARPFLDRSAEEGRQRQLIVLVDRSASMQARGEGGGTVFDAAVAAARKELDAMDENTAVRVGLFDAGGVAELELTAVDSSLLPAAAATDYGLALGWARDVVTTSGRPQRRVVVITDLQRSGLDRSPLAGFPADLDLVVHDVGRNMSNNVSIESCRAVVTEIRPKEPVRVDVHLHNAGALAVKKLNVAVRLEGPEGKLASTQQTTLDGGARTTLEFPFPDIQRDGVYHGQVEITLDDDLQFDNRRWLAFEARHPDRLLLVDGQQGRSVYGSETYYLETALRLRGAVGEAPTRSFEVERIVWEDGEGFPDLAGFRCLVMANVRRVSDVDVKRLADYVESGGNLLFFVGNQTTPAQLDQLARAGLFTGSIARDSSIGPWRVDHWDERHPLLEPFRDPQQGDLRRLVFERLVEVRDLGLSARVLLAAENHPLLIEQPLGKGTSLYFLVAADRDWGDWPQSRLYVPLVRQATAYLTSQLTGRQAVSEQLVTSGDVAAGITQEDGRTLVRNLDAAESRLERVSENEFRQALGIPERAAEAVLADLAATVAPPPGTERPNETWDVVMWLLLGVLTVEMLLASRVHA